VKQLTREYVEQLILWEMKHPPLGKTMERKDDLLCVTEPDGLFYCYPFMMPSLRGERRSASIYANFKPPRKRKKGG
jgi:hypothetical protein